LANAQKKKNIKKKTTKKPVKKVNKKQPIKSVKNKIAKPVVNKTKKPTKKKDILVISILSILLIAIIVLLIVLNPTQDNNNNNNNNLENDLNTTNEDINYTQEDLELLLKDLEKRLNKEIISKQLAIFEEWCDELSIDKDLMDACLATNDYTKVDNTNYQNATVLSKIMEDISLAQYSLGFSGTPGIVVNNHKLDGYLDYENFKKRIDAALEDVDNNISQLTFEDSNITTYNYDANQDPVLYIIYNKNHEFSSEEIQNTITRTTTSEYAPLFEKIFDLETESVHYLDLPKDIEDLMNIYNINLIPFFYIEGDISKLELTDEEQEVFNGFFYEINKGSYFWQYQSTYITDYTFIKNIKDYIIGSKDAKVSVFIFTDYNCGYCKKFEDEVVPRIMEDYVDTNLVNIIIKDFVIYQAPSLFPTVFARCAEQQGRYEETHKKLFENVDLYGSTFVNEIMEGYMDEYQELQTQYEKLQE
jgi:protein-disulfide isomerase